MLLSYPDPNPNIDPNPNHDLSCTLPYQIHHHQVASSKCVAVFMMRRQVTAMQSVERLSGLTEYPYLTLSFFQTYMHIANHFVSLLVQ